jgi:pyruvate/2-oxoglutarate dehydrogenase complex dihydrolipoamide dehydrogenase (E3) component
MYDLIAIGGGPGGYEAAAHAGRMGTTVSEALREAILGVH